MRDQLAASRARVIASADESRRRIERNLHDGAQQRLVSLALQLRMIKRAIGNDSPAAALLTQAHNELEQALGELRELARGIHPAILTDQGLEAALDALALRAPLPVEITACPQRLPAPVEAAAYYIVSEAITNASKHAAATRAWVSLRVEDGTLHLSVRDDGVGGADPARGSGLLGLRDRVEALAGTIEIESPPGAGTRLGAAIPVT
jgi:signal transduction histidine kinase